MALHKYSSVMALSRFDLFSVPPTQLQVAEDMPRDNTPFTSIANSNSQIQFSTSTTIDEYVLFDKSELYVKLRIDLKKDSQKADEQLTLTDWKKICPVNYLINTLWKTVNLSIGTFPVNSTTLNYAYISYLDALLNIPKDVKQTHLVSAMWHSDTPGLMDQINEVRSVNIRPINGDNSQSCEIELLGYLHLDLCAQKRAMLGGVKIDLTLHPNAPKFYLMHDNHLRPTVRFTEVKFEFHRSKLIPQAVVAHNRALATHTVKYPITRKECKNYIVQKDAIEYHENNVLKNERLPNKAFIALVNNEAFNGSNAMNPFNFKNYDIQNIMCVVNSKEFPPRGFECDFKTRHINKAFRGLYEAMGQIDNPRCSITRNEFINGYTVFGFNFIPDLSDGVNRNGYISPIKVGDMSLHIRFRSPLPETATVIVLMEYDNLIELPESRLPFKDFT